MACIRVREERLDTHEISGVCHSLAGLLRVSRYLVECRLVRWAGTRYLDGLAVRAVYCAIAVTGA